MRIEDYRDAIGPETGMILSVHSSNFKLVGFVGRPSRKEIALLAKERGIPFVEDLGSGYLNRYEAIDFPEEPTVKEALDDGVDLLTFSGDKLLGGPQAGIIVGRADLVQKLRDDSLFRALRPDKMQLAALEETLLAYRRAGDQPPDLPFWEMAKASFESLEARGKAMIDSLSKLRPEFHFAVEESMAQPGSGSVPGLDLASRALTLRAPNRNINKMDDELRDLDPPIFARVNDDRLFFDLRTVLPAEDQDLVDGIASLP